MLAAAAGVLTRIRRRAKPLHPAGQVVLGELTRTGGAPASGVRWLDGRSRHEVLVRRSRALGLPGPLPDIHGLAIRTPTADGFADLLFATTGLGRLTRFVLTFSRHPETRPLTTLLPYRSAHGPVLLAARAVSAGRYELLWARALRPWVRFADLQLLEDSGPDVEVSFDPLLNTPPGLDTYPWVRQLREPAYRAARETSGRELDS